MLVHLGIITVKLSLKLLFLLICFKMHNFTRTALDFSVYCTGCLLTISWSLRSPRGEWDGHRKGILISRGRAAERKGKLIDGYIESGEELVLLSDINYSCVL